MSTLISPHIWTVISGCLNNYQPLFCSLLPRSENKRYINDLTEMSTCSLPGSLLCWCTAWSMEPWPGRRLLSPAKHSPFTAAAISQHKCFPPSLVICTNTKVALPQCGQISCKNSSDQFYQRLQSFGVSLLWHQEDFFFGLVLPLPTQPGKLILFISSFKLPRYCYTHGPKHSCLVGFSYHLWSWTYTWIF